MYERTLKMAVVVAMVSLAAGAASAQRLSAGGKFEAAKNQEAGKYAACLQGGGAPDQDARPVFGYRREFSL